MSRARGCHSIAANSYAHHSCRSADAFSAAYRAQGEAWDIEAVIKVGDVSRIVVDLGGDDYVCLPASQVLSGPRGAMPIPPDDGRLQLRILVDKTTVEVFSDRGQAYGMCVRDNPGANASLEARTWKAPWGGVHVEKLSVHSLKSAWTA